MREARAAKIHKGAHRGDWGARVTGNPKPEIGEVVKVTRAKSDWVTYEKLSKHIFSARNREGEVVRIYATLPAQSEVGQVTAGEIQQFGKAFQEWGRLLVEGKHRAAGEAMLKFGMQVEAGYKGPDEEAADE